MARLRNVPLLVCSCNTYVQLAKNESCNLFPNDSSDDVPPLLPLPAIVLLCGDPPEDTSSKSLTVNFITPAAWIPCCSNRLSKKAL